MSRSSIAGGVVLCGGLSRRMRQPKPWLPFGDELLLQRVVRIVSAVVDRVVVAAASDLELPPLPDDILRVDDRQETDSPLEGIASGLEALPPNCHTALVVACDLPLLQVDLLRAVFAAQHGHQAAMPFVDGKLHPLVAAYDIGIAPVVRACLAKGRRSLGDLLLVLDVVRLPRSVLCSFDPNLTSLMNVNTPEDYQRALRVAGLAEPAFQT